MNKNNYTYKKLGEVCEILNGFAFKSEKYVDKGIRVIRITNVQKGRIEDNDPQYYPIETTTEIKRYMLKEGDLLMSLTGNVGRVGILQSTMLPAALNQRVACVRLNNNDIILDFLFHYFNSDLFENNCIYSAKGIAQKNMSTEWLKEQKIPVPPLATQRKIVAELDCLNNIIAKKRLQLQEYDSLAQALFHQTFGDPVDNDMGWGKKKISIVAPAKEYKGTIPSTNGKYWLLNLDMIESNTGKILNKQWFNKSEIGSSTISFNTDNVLYSKLRPYLNKVVVPTEAGFATSELIPLCPQKDLLNRLFLAHLLRNTSFVKYIQEKVAGAKMPRVAMNTFREFCVILPPLSLQQQFAAKIEAIEAQKARIWQSVAEVQTLLNYTMDKYFG